jgi:hypothetical protein
LALGVLYALVAVDCDYVVDLFASRAAAEVGRSRVVADEPNFAEIMAIVELGDLPPFEVSTN